jgi:hypothetical protein
MAIATKPRAQASIRAEIHAKLHCIRAARRRDDTKAIEILHDQINALLDQLLEQP